MTSKWLERPSNPPSGVVVDQKLSHTPRARAKEGVSEDDEFVPWRKASSVKARAVIRKLEGTTTPQEAGRGTPKSKSSQMLEAFAQREAKLAVAVSHEREEEYCQSFLQCVLMEGLEADSSAAFCGAWRAQIAESRRLEEALDRLYQREGEE